MTKAPDVSVWPVDGDAISHPDAVEPKIALDNVCAKFFLVYICQRSQNYQDLLYVLFLSVLLNTIIYHNSNNKPRERIRGAAEHRSLGEHCMSSAEASDLPRNVKVCVCIRVCVCVCTILGVQMETARVKKAQLQ